MDEEKFIGVPIAALRPAGGSDRFVVSPQPPFLRVLPDVLARMVQEADRFRTLEEHVARLHEKGWPSEGSEVFLADYRRLAEMGLLRSWDEFLAAASAKGADPDPASVAWLVWPTRNRHEMLIRSLESWVAKSRQYARSIGFLICDDSDPQVAATNRKAAVRVAEREGVPVHYAGADERAAFVAALASAGVPEALARFALFDTEGLGDPYDITRNATLLATAGEAFLSTDDDTLCRFALPQEPKPGLRLFSFADPTDIRFHESREHLLASVRFADEDPWVPHERLLGRAVGSLMTQSPDEINTAGLTPEFADHLAAGRGRVAITSTGACGHSGMRSSRIVLRLAGPMRQRLSDARQYLMAVNSAEVLNVVNQETICFLPSFMAMSFACDNRLLLPPFFPVKRGMDGFWGTTIGLCAPDALIAHIPRAVMHDAPSSRRVTRDGATSYTPGLAEYLRTAVSGFHPPEGLRDPEALMERLGKFLIEMSLLDRSSFERMLKEQWAEGHSRDIDFLENLLLLHQGRPEPWGEDVKRHIEALQRFAESSTFCIPADLAGLGPEAAADLLLPLIRRFGELLVAWPEIVSVAKSLRGRGAGLGRPLG